MATTLYKYTFVCSTENAEKNVWRRDDEPVPTKCPDDTSHTINTSTLRITDKVSKEVVKIQEETVPTGGNFKCRSESIDILPNETKIVDRTFPFNISALAIEFNSDADNQGDNLELIVGPNTIIGAITSPVNIGDNVINVNSTVVENLNVGFKINLFNGSITENLGFVIAIDKDNLTITTQNTSTQSFSHLTPTYIRMSVYVIEDYVIGKSGRWEIGGNKIGGSFVPANVIIRIVYYNNSGVSKNFTAQLEYLY